MGGLDDGPRDVGAAGAAGEGDASTALVAVRGASVGVAGHGFVGRGVVERLEKLW